MVLDHHGKGDWLFVSAVPVRWSSFVWVLKTQPSVLFRHESFSSTKTPERKKVVFARSDFSVIVLWQSRWNQFRRFVAYSHFTLVKIISPLLSLRDASVNASLLFWEKRRDEGQTRWWPTLVILVSFSFGGKMASGDDSYTPSNVFFLALYVSGACRCEAIVQILERNRKKPICIKCVYEQMMMQTSCTHS